MRLYEGTKDIYVFRGEAWASERSGQLVVGDRVIVLGELGKTCLNSDLSPKLYVVCDVNGLKRFVLLAPFASKTKPKRTAYSPACPYKPKAR